MFKIYAKMIAEDKGLLRIIVAYPGRFSPPTKAHGYVYKLLCSEFGADNVFILTANPKQLNDKNPFTFDQKKEMLIAAGISTDKIKQMQGSAYRWEDIAKSIGLVKPETVSLVSAMGAKDAERVDTTKYYQEYDATSELEPMNVHGYIKIVDNMKNDSDEIMNASAVRAAFKSGDMDIVRKSVEPGVFTWLTKNWSK